MLRENVRTCRFCGAHLSETFVDLGMSPPSNAFLAPHQLADMERFYPLHAYVCTDCFLVQLEEFQSPAEIFGEYAYFSSYSSSWLDHCEAYARRMVDELGLGSESRVVEVASNDGYLLQYFARRGVPVLGIEPAANVAVSAERGGVRTLVEFFGADLARRLDAEGLGADLLIGNNVLAHVPRLNDFVAGLKILLRPQGTITLEFPHLLQLMQNGQFDTIYHEHFSYFSLLTARRLFAAHELEIVDVEEIPTHGGSLRIFVKHAGHAALPSVEALVSRERAAGLDAIGAYRAFAETAMAAKRGLLAFLIAAKGERRSIVGYGAAAKGTTLLNYCGIRTDFIEYIVDRNSFKQGRYLPGCRIPILDPSEVSRTKPDYVLILPWNIRDEIVEQMAFVRDWGCRFVVPIPEVRVT